MSHTDAIQKLYGAFDAAVNAGDVDGWLAVQTEDCTWLPPDRPAVAGKEAVRAYVQDAWFGLFNMTVKSTIEEAVATSDSDAWARGSWTMDLVPKDGSEPSTVAGTLLSVLRRESGDWRVARTAFSTLD